jgi:hypothetical protein
LDEVKFGLTATLVKGVDEIMPGAEAEWEIYQWVTVRVKQFR